MKAYSDDLGESVECTDIANDLSDDLFEKISVEQVNDEEKFVVVDDIEFSDQTTCGETVTGSFTVFNVGDEDQDRVKITMSNSELNLNKEFEITEDLDQGEDKRIQFSFNVPDNAQNKDYVIGFKTEYDYRSGEYRQESKDTFVKSLRVIGCAGTGTQPPAASGLAITASLDSDAKAGEELTVSTIFTNTGQSPKTVALDAKDFESWAELISISPRTFVINPAETKTATFKFSVNTDASDSNSFIIEALADGSAELQEVEVSIEGKSTITGRGIFANLGSGSSLIWIIAVVNVVLILLIILVAVKLSRR